MLTLKIIGKVSLVIALVGSGGGRRRLAMSLHVSLSLSVAVAERMKEQGQMSAYVNERVYGF